jgi:AraC family transcriptional regulator
MAPRPELPARAADSAPVTAEAASLAHGETGIDTRRSAIPFLDARSRRPVDALEDTSLVASSKRLGWSGIVVEAGSNDTWEVDDLTVAHHYLAMNVGDAPLHFEVKEAHGFRPAVIEPGAVWVCPAGESFTHRVAQQNSFALVTVDPVRFAMFFGATPGGGDAPQLRRDYNLRSPQLEHVVRALVVEADRGGPSGTAFVDALAIALSHQLVHLAGERRVVSEPTRGGLAPAARQRVLELVDERLERGVSVDELAREAGLSPAHFARAFKESVGRPPHQHILARRLERARQLLDAPRAQLSDVALRTGFSDQAHFTRHFKRAFGVTPGEVLRTRKF